MYSLAHAISNDGLKRKWLNLWFKWKFALLHLSLLLCTFVVLSKILSTTLSCYYFWVVSMNSSTTASTGTARVEFERLVGDEKCKTRKRDMMWMRLGYKWKMFSKMVWYCLLCLWKKRIWNEACIYVQFLYNFCSNCFILIYLIHNTVHSHTLFTFITVMLSWKKKSLMLNIYSFA